MSHSQSHLRSQQGSVLTEFLIVAPLYLLLMGGLLLSHDMLRVKNKILMVDDFVTVTGTHRMMRDSGDAITKHVNGVWGDFQPQTVNVPLMIANEYQSNNGKKLVNKWNAVYAGRVDVEYKLPYLIHSMLSMQRIIFGDESWPEQPTSFRFYADPKTGAFPAENDCRYHVIQRHWVQGGDKKFDRSQSAEKLVTNGVMANVLQDQWLFTDEVKGVSTSGDENASSYKQQLAEYAE